MIKNKAIFSLIALAMILASCDNNSQTSTESTTQEESQTPLDSINQRILEEPNVTDNYLVRAEIWRDKDSIQLALDDLDRSLRLDSTQDNALKLQGDILYNEKMIKEARYVYERCARFNPENKDCLLKLAEIEFLLRITLRLLI